MCGGFYLVELESFSRSKLRHLTSIFLRDDIVYMLIKSIRSNKLMKLMHHMVSVRASKLYQNIPTELVTMTFLTKRFKICKQLLNFFSMLAGKSIYKCEFFPSLFFNVLLVDDTLPRSGVSNL